jgi:hypothetical protein
MQKQAAGSEDISKPTTANEFIWNMYNARGEFKGNAHHLLYKHSRY